MRIVAKEKHHSSLSESYNKIMKRSQTHGTPAAFRTNSTQYHNSFLPGAICDLKAQTEQTVSYSASTGLTPTANTIYTGHTEPVLIDTDQID